MNHHIGDTNKMVDTPRTDAAKKIVLGGVGGDWEVVHIAFSRQLERELNAAHVEIERLTNKVAQLYEGGEEQKQRIKRLEEAGSLALGYAAKGDLESADEVWNKAKEVKPGLGFDKKWFTDADIEAIIGDCHGYNNSKL